MAVPDGCIFGCHAAAYPDLFLCPEILYSGGRPDGSQVRSLLCVLGR